MKFGRREWVKSCEIYLTKNNKISPASQTVATAWMAPKIRQGQPPTMYSRVLQISSKSVHNWQSDSRTRQRRQLPSKVNPILGRSLASSQIKSMQNCTVHACLTTNIILRPLPVLMQRFLLCRYSNSGKMARKNALKGQIRSHHGSSNDVNNVNSLFLVFFTHDDISLGNTEWRRITVRIRCVLKQHEVIFTNLHQHVTAFYFQFLFLMEQRLYIQHH